MVELWRPGASHHDGLQNIAGEPVAVGEFYAEYLPGQGRERFANSENVATAPAVFTIRWSDGVAEMTPLWWLVFEGREYQIERVEEVGRRVALRIAGTARADKSGAMP